MLEREFMALGLLTYEDGELGDIEAAGDMDDEDIEEAENASWGRDIDGPAPGVSLSLSRHLFMWI